jgi:hypothetical protein
VDVATPNPPTANPSAPSSPTPNAPTPNAQVTAPSTAAPSGPADARLQQLQSRAVESARAELDHHVSADRSNRSARVDEYARDAGMNPGYAWCGFFTGFNYDQAARADGVRFHGNSQFHSFEKARAYFEYRNYTNNSRSENSRLDQLQADQTAAGSPRRWMVLDGSTGQHHAESNHRPCEVYQPDTLPVRPGDTVLFNFGHVGMVENYDPATHQLTTIEGNSTGGRVARHTYDLNDPRVRARIDGFGRPSAGDFS